MASLQVRHVRACPLATRTSAAKAALEGCTCRPTYRVTWWQDGKLRREPAGKNRRQAEATLRKIATKLDDGVYLTPESITFATWADRWIASLQRPVPSTITSYRSTLDYARMAFGKKLVKRLTVEDVVDILDLMRQADLSGSTQAKHLRVLGSCLRAAVRHGHAAQNPVERLDASLRPRAEAREAAWFEDEELPRLFEEVPAGLFHVLLATALKTGARQGELVAARWSDISLSDAVFRVRRSYSGGHLSTPKTLAGQRDIHLTTDTVTRLGNWWGKLGKPDDHTLVFPGEGHEYLAGWLITKRELYGAMKRAGIQRTHPKTGTNRTFHSLRHTFSRIALENGRSLPWLQRHLGHSSLAVTVGIYGHIGDHAARREIAELEGAFSV